MSYNLERHEDIFAIMSPSGQIYTRIALCLNFNTHTHTRTHGKTVSLSRSLILLAKRERIGYGLVSLSGKIKQKIEEEAEQEAQGSDLINLWYFCEKETKIFPKHYLYLSSIFSLSPSGMLVLYFYVDAPLN